jgi:mRNA-degrading endonuclease RelE of RelBE toxin-antitoxin system
VSYVLTYRPSAARDLARLPPALQDRLMARIEALSDEPRGPATKPLTGPLRGLHSLRVGDTGVLRIP